MSNSDGRRSVEFISNSMLFVAPKSRIHFLWHFEVSDAGVTHSYDTHKLSFSLNGRETQTQTERCDLIGDEQQCEGSGD